jgi:hypothetical protein
VKHLNKNSHRKPGNRHERKRNRNEDRRRNRAKQNMHVNIATATAIPNATTATAVHVTTATAVASSAIPNATTATAVHVTTATAVHVTTATAVASSADEKMIALDTESKKTKMEILVDTEKENRRKRKQQRKQQRKQENRRKKKKADQKQEQENKLEQERNKLEQERKDAAHDKAVRDILDKLREFFESNVINPTTFPIDWKQLERPSLRGDKIGPIYRHLGLSKATDETQKCSSALANSLRTLLTISNDDEKSEWSSERPGVLCKLRQLVDLEDEDLLSMFAIGTKATKFMHGHVLAGRSRREYERGRFDKHLVKELAISFLVLLLMALLLLVLLLLLLSTTSKTILCLCSSHLGAMPHTACCLILVVDCSSPTQCSIC